MELRRNTDKNGMNRIFSYAQGAAFAFRFTLALLCLSACGTPVKQTRLPAAKVDIIAQLENCETGLTKAEWADVQKELIESGAVINEETAKALVIYAKNGAELVRYDQSEYKTELDLFAMAFKRGWLGASLKSSLSELKKARKVTGEITTPEGAIDFLQKSAAENEQAPQKVADQVVFGIVHSLYADVSEPSYVGLKSSQERKTLRKIPGDAFVPLRNWVAQELQKDGLGELGNELREAWPDYDGSFKKIKNRFTGRRRPSRFHFGSPELPAMPYKEKTAFQLATEPNHALEGFKKLENYEIRQAADVEFLLAAHLMEFSHYQLTRLVDIAKDKASASPIVAIAESRLAQLDTIKKAREAEDEFYYTVLYTKDIPKFEKTPEDEKDYRADRTVEYVRDNFENLPDAFWERYRNNHKAQALLPTELRERANKEIYKTYQRETRREHKKAAADIIAAVEKALPDFDAAAAQGAKFVERAKSELTHLEALRASEAAIEKPAGVQLMDYGSAIETLNDISEAWGRAGALDLHQSLNFKADGGEPRLAEVVAVEGFHRVFPAYGTRLDFESLNRVLETAGKVIAKNMESLTPATYEQLLQTIREHVRNLDLSFKEQDALKNTLQTQAGALAKKTQNSALFKDVLDKVLMRAWSARSPASLDELERLIALAKKNVINYESILEKLRKRRLVFDEFKAEKQREIEQNDKELKELTKGQG